MTAAERTRQARGARRRQAILEAALAVIAERGVAATTHRAIAERAEVPVAATTYYFESLDELLDEALLLFVREEAQRLTALSARLEDERLAPAEIAQLLLAELRKGQGGETRAEADGEGDAVLEGRSVAEADAAVGSEEAGGQLPAEVGQFELYLEAARRPRLRAAARQALDLYAEAAEAALRAAGSPRPAEGARLFVALLDGFGLHRLASGRDENVADALLALLIPFAMDDDERARWDQRLRGR